MDENFPKRIITLLEYRKFEIHDIRNTKHEGMSDIELFDLAQTLDAAIFTTDRDFLTAIHRNNPGHSGILVVALDKPNSDSIIKETIAFLDRVPVSEWRHHCYVLTGSGKCRVYN